MCRLPCTTSLRATRFEAVELPFEIANAVVDGRPGRAPWVVFDRLLCCSMEVDSEL